MSTPDCDVEPHDIVQLAPKPDNWGPMLVIVTEVKAWGVQGYWMVAEKRGVPPACAYIRVKHGDYVRVGRAEWSVKHEHDV